MADRDDAILAAIQQAPQDQRTADGRPKLTYLNSRLKEEGHDEITAEDRDRIWNNPGHDENAVGSPDGTRDVGGRATDPDASVAATPEAPAPAAPATVAQPAGQEENLRDGTMTPADASRVEATTAAPPAGAGTGDDDEPPENWRRVKITRASTNPVTLYVHGVGRFTLELNREHRLPAEAISALRDSDAEIEELDDEEEDADRNGGAGADEGAR